MEWMVIIALIFAASLILLVVEVRSMDNTSRVEDTPEGTVLESTLHLGVVSRVLYRRDSFTNSYLLKDGCWYVLPKMKQVVHRGAVSFLDLQLEKAKS